MRYLFCVLILCGACAPVDEIDDTPFDANTCEVIRRDVATGVVVDQFVFSDLGLVTHAWQLAPGTRGLRVNTYANGLLVSAESEAWHRAAETQTYGAWQGRTAIYESDTYFRHDLKFSYDATGQLTRWDTRATTSNEDIKDVSLRRVVYSRNKQGQKIREDQYSNDAREPWLANTYTYRSQDGRLENIHTVQDGRPRDLRYFYDENGRLIRRAQDDYEGLRYDFDEHGRLIGWNGQRRYTRNVDGLIVATTSGMPATFTYVDGRLATANYEDGSAYTQTYSSGCPSGFSHPVVTPSSLHHEHYEGPPMHHTWSNY